MADYIQDSLATALDPYEAAHDDSASSGRGSRDQAVPPGLLSPEPEPATHRGLLHGCETPNVAPAGGVAPTSLGIFRVLILVTTLPTMDDIVLDTQIGDSVVNSAGDLRRRAWQPIKESEAPTWRWRSPTAVRFRTRWHGDRELLVALSSSRRSCSGISV